jgi:regulator of replication initiation timing
MSDERIYYTNRTLCDVLESMRKCYEIRDFSYLPAQIEELQYLGNRMEANLQDVKDVKDLLVERSTLKSEVFKLREELAKQRLLKEKEYKPPEESVMTNEEWLNANLEGFTGVEDEYPEAWEDAMLRNAQ